jgi:hypothetical protein
VDKLYDVSLYFLEPHADQAGSRSVGVKLQDILVIKDLDVFQEAGGRQRVIVKEIKGVQTSGSLSIELDASVGKTLLSGIRLALSVD